MKRFQNLIKNALCFLLAACMVVSMLLSNVGTIKAYAADEETGIEQYSEENAVDEGLLAGEEKTSVNRAFDQIQEVYINEEQTAWVRVQAPSGVFPSGSQLEVQFLGTNGTADENSEEVQAALDAVEEVKAEDNDNRQLSSYVFDIKVYDENGYEIQPNTEYGLVSVKFGLSNKSEIASKLEDAAKNDLARDIAESGEVDEAEAMEMVENLNLSVTGNDISCDVYHIEEDGAEKLDTKKSSDTAAGAEIVLAVTTDSFSLYTVSFSVATESNAPYYHLDTDDRSVLLSDILRTLGVEGEVKTVSASNQEIIIVPEGNDYRITLPADRNFDLLSVTVEKNGRISPLVIWIAGNEYSSYPTFEYEIKTEEDMVVSADLTEDIIPAAIEEGIFPSEVEIDLDTLEADDTITITKGDNVTVSIEVGQSGNITFQDVYGNDYSIHLIGTLVQPETKEYEASYVVKGYPNGYEEGVAPNYSVDLADIISDEVAKGNFPEDLTIEKVAGITSAGNRVSVDGTILTVNAKGGLSGVVTFFDTNGNTYTVTLSSDQIDPLNSYEPTEAVFTSIFNDNTGDSKKDVTNAGDRPVPSAELINAKYSLQFAIDDGELLEWTFANLAAALGLTEEQAAEKGFHSLFNEYTLSDYADTTTNASRWSFAFANRELPKSFLMDGETKQISFAIVQDGAFDYYIEPTEDGIIAMGNSIVNTVETKYEASVVLMDNNNKYDTRPDFTPEDIYNLKGTILEDFSIYRYRGDENMSHAELLFDAFDPLSQWGLYDIEVIDGTTYVYFGDDGQFVFMSTPNEDGTYTWELGGLPNYAEDGTSYNYFIETSIIPDEEKETVASGTTYINEYDNVDNFAAVNTGLFNGGTLEAVLSNVIPFVYDKSWTDTDASARPSAQLNIYCISEDTVLEAERNHTVLDPSNFSPVNNFSATAVPKEDQTDIVLNKTGVLYTFPLYNNDGSRLIYLALETGLTGEYASGVNNAGALSTSKLKDDYYPNADTNAAVISQFDKIIKTYYSSTNEAYNYSFPKYLLNGGAIDNCLIHPVTVKADITLEATAMASMESATAHLVLQQWDNELEQWVPVTNGDLVNPLVGIPADTPIEEDIVFDDSERLATSVVSSEVPKYDAEGNLIHYRWKEVSLSLNGGEEETIIWIGEETEPGKAYESEHTDMGKLGPGVGEELTSVYLDADMSAESLQGSQWASVINNAIKADIYVEVVKTWILDGVNVTSAIGDAGGSATFKIKRSDGKESVTNGQTPGANALYDVNGEVVYDVVLNKDDEDATGNAWAETVYNLVRFDEGGHEYVYTPVEVSINPGSYEEQNWGSSITFANTVVDGKDIEGSRVKQTNAYVVNTNDVGETLYFSVEKRWLDGGDLFTRKPVNTALYKINADGTALLISHNLVLDEADNWFNDITIGEDTVYEYSIDASGNYTENTTGETIGTGNLGTIADYVIVETGESKDDPDLMTKYGQAGHTYLQLTPSELRQIRAKILADDFEGDYTIDKVIMGLADNESDPSGKSEYSYNVYGKFGNQVNERGENHYSWTNQRVATLKISLVKNWADAGERRTGKFQLIRMDYDGQNATKVLDFELGGNTPTDNNPIKPEGKEFTYQRTNDGKKVVIDFNGLDKYDCNGDPYVYRITETAIWDEGADAWVEIEGGRAIISAGDRYAVAVAKQETVIPENYLHHNDRLEKWAASNNYSDSYELNFYKVWYDEGTYAEDTIRPQLYFDICRLTENAVLDNGETLREYIDGIFTGKSGHTYENLSDLVAVYLGSHSSSQHSMNSDRIWVTDLNEWAWECNIGTVPTYDSAGNKYVYFAKERTALGYKTININDLSENLSVNTSDTVQSPEEAIDVAEQIESEERAGFVLISDGEKHGQDIDSAGKAFTRTIVNYRENVRTLSGKKVWKMPSGITIPTENLPTVTFKLYRALTPIVDPESGEEMALYHNSDVRAWIESADAEHVLDITLHTDAENVEGSHNFNFPNYVYSVSQEAYGEGQNPLPKYNEYGLNYHYYVLEDASIEGYRYAEGVEYNTADFYVINNYLINNPPYAEVAVEKDWDIDDIAELQGVEIKDLAPVKISLYAQAFEKDNPTVEAGKPVLFATKTVDPADAEDGKIRFIFDEFTESVPGIEDGSKLPYYAPTGGRYQYFVVEEFVHGYDQTLTIGGESVESAIENKEYIDLPFTREDAERNTIYSNVKITEDAQGNKTWEEDRDNVEVIFDNLYIGEEKNFKAIKYWTDEYVDNDEYRPESITLTVKRKSANGNDTAYEKQVVLSKVPKSNTWSVTLEHLVKYDPLGAEYTYYIASESSGSFVAESVGDHINDFYVLKSINSDGSITNELDTEYELSIHKDWTYIKDDKESFINSWNTFVKLRQMNALPKDVKYVVIRSTDGTNWETVDASNEGSAVQKVTVIEDGREKQVLGYYLNIKNLTADKFYTLFNGNYSWKHLPKADENGAIYQYNMKEIMDWEKINPENPSAVITETVEYINGSNINGLKSTFGVKADDKAVAITAKNNLETSKVRLAKKWEDEKDYDNTRPATITVTFKSKITGETFKYVLETAGSEDNSTYYSDYFYLPNVDVIELNDTNYDIIEVADSKTSKGTEPSDYTYIWKDENHKIYYSKVDDAYSLNLTNTLDIKRKTIGLEATKKWASESDLWKDSLRPTVTFTLQYKDRATGQWTDMTAANIVNFYDPNDVTAQKPAPVPSQVVTFDTAALKQINSQNTVYWYHLFKYWKDNAVDGVPELIEYRVKETLAPTVNNYSNNKGGIISYKFLDGTDYYTGSITNTFNATQFTVKKVWNGGTLTKAQVKTRVMLDALPESIDMVLEYTSVANPAESDWAVYPYVIETNTTAGHFTFHTVDDFAKKTVNAFLPKYDAEGNTYYYRVKEYSVKYYNSGDIQYRDETTGKIGNFTVTDGDAKSWTSSTPSFSVKNEYDYGKLLINKKWRDEDNREGREGTITVKVTGVNVDRSVTTTLSASNNWSSDYIELPKYNHDETELAKYTVEEIKLDSTNASGGKVGVYNISYDPETPEATFNAGTTVTIKAINTYIPQRGSVAATKEWIGDDLWKSVTRPGSVTVKLQYMDASGSWKDITTAALDADGLYPDGGVYTTTENISQVITTKADGTWSTEAKWDNLPVYFNQGHDNAHKVQYRVVETKVDDYTISYTSNSVTLANGQTTSITTKNTLDTTKINVSKKWISDDGTPAELSDSQINMLVQMDALPKSLEMVVEYSTDGNNWNAIPTVIETGKENGHFTFNTLTDLRGKEVDAKLPKSAADGTAIQYRVREVSATYESGTVVRADDSAVIGNLIVTDSDTATWDGSRTKPSFTLKNTFESGHVTVLKNWQDEDDREGLEKTIKVKLYGVDSDDSLTADLTSANSWTKTWYDLPLKNHEGTGYQTYSVDEIQYNGQDVSGTKAGPYTLSYDPDNHNGTITTKGGKLTITAINTYVPQRGTVIAEKKWEDGDWSDTTRPNSVTVKLQYKLGNGQWTDITMGSLDANGLYQDGGVYTTSDPVQIIMYWNVTQNWNKAEWKDLPVYYNQNQTDKVQYRVVETSVSGYLISYESDQVVLTNNTESKDDVTNTLKTTNIDVYKNWKKNSQATALTKAQIEELIALDALPSSLDMVVEFSTDGSNWNAIPTVIENGKAAGHFTFDTLADFEGKKNVAANLPQYASDGSTLISYRVREVSATYASETVERDTTGNIGNLVVTDSDTVTWDGTTVKPSFTLTNTYRSGKITVKKVWEDENNRDQLRAAITVRLTGVNTEKTLEATLTGSMEAKEGLSYTWDNIPVKGHDGNTATYKVDEIKIGNEVVSDGKAGGYEVTYTPQSGQIPTGGELVLKAVNTHIPAKGSIIAAKAWEGDEIWKDQVRPNKVTVTLQYMNEEGQWVNVGRQESIPYPDTGIYTTSPVTQTIEYWPTTENWNPAEWKDLSVYFDDGQTKVHYRVVEDAVTGYKTSYSFDANGVVVEDAQAKDVTVTNTFDDTTLRIHKNWELNGADETLVLPDSISFKVEYGIKDATGAVAEWNALANYKYKETAGQSAEKQTDADGKVTINKPSEDLTNWTEVLFEHLPKVDADGAEYSYRVSEVEVTFGNNVVAVEGQWAADGTTWEIMSAGSFGGTEDSSVVISGDEGGYTATALNTLEVGNVAAEKIWDDQDNRDNSRLTSIQFQLYRDGEAYGTAVTLTAGSDGHWTSPIKHEWTNVPLYQSGATSHTDSSLSKYTVQEIATWKDGQTYTTYYSVGEGEKDTDYTKVFVNAAEDSDDALITVTNFFQPKLGTVKASKKWDDFDNYYQTRPEKIYFKLQYRVGTEGAWEDVVKKDSKDYPDDGVYTTSEIIQEITVAASEEEQKDVAIWENVPYFTEEGKAVYYKVVETDAEGNILPGQDTEFAYDTYIVSYSYDVNGETFTADVDTLGQTVTNTMKINGLNLMKVWEGDETWKQLVRPSSVTFKVEYKTKDDTEWALFNSFDGKIVNGLITVDEDVEWKASVEYIPDNYLIRVSEAKITFNGENVSVGAGEWATSGTTSTWTGAAGAYDAEVATEYDDTTKTWEVSATNTLATGKISTRKEWIDANNRDGFRDEIKVNLHREESVNGATVDEVIDTVTLNNQAWSHTWTNLPINTIDGKAAYYWVEEDLTEKRLVDEKYDTTYTLGSGNPTPVAENAKTELDAETEKNIKVTNTHIPEVLSLDVTKYWDDNTNYYGLRDTSIDLLMQYSTDGGNSWIDANASSSIVIENTPIAERPAGNADNGLNIYSASLNEQELTGSASENVWGTVEWNDLSAYVLVNGVSTKVKYRVVEKDHPGYIVTDSDSVDIDSKGEETSVKVENKLDPTVVKVHKNWTLSEDILAAYGNILPDSITVQLQYSADEGQSWNNVTKNGTATLTKDNNWSATFDQGLRKNYKYRVVEVSMTWGDKTVEVKDPSGTIVYATEGEIGNFDYTSSTTYSEEDGYATELSNELSTTTLAVVKNWKDEENRDNLRKGLTINLYRDLPEGFDLSTATEAEKAEYRIATSTITTETQNIVTWDNLPTYKNGSDSEPSVYTIEEILDGQTVGTYETTAPKTVSIDPETGKGSMDISNIHYPNKGNITAIKYWEDFDNFYGERTDIYLTLMYRTNADEAWTPVTQASLIEDDPEITGKLYPDGDVHTTSAPIQKIELTDPVENVQSATWENLPKVINLDWDEDPTPVIYKVIETDENGFEIEKPGNYTITYGSEDGNVFTEDEEGKLEPITQDITNTYDVIDLTLKKTWVGDEDEYARLARPAKVTFLIEKSIEISEEGEDIWEPVNTPDGETVVDGLITLTEDTGWEVTIADLQIAYGEIWALYRVSEASIEYEDGTVVEVVAGDFIYDEHGSIFVDEKITWTGSNNVGAYSGSVVVTPLYEETPEEAEKEFIGWQAEAENVLTTGKLKVTKLWDDENNKYERRPAKIQVQLYRDGKAFGKPVEIIGTSNTWEYEWTDLPVYTDDPSDEDTKSEYYVEEVVPKDYHVTYKATDQEVKKASEAVVVLATVEEPEEPEIVYAGPEEPDGTVVTPVEPKEPEAAKIIIKNILNEDVKTGDGNKTILWVITMLASMILGTTAGLLSMKRKKRNK